MNGKKLLDGKNLIFSCFLFFAVLIMYAPLKSLYLSSDHKDYYSHIILIPLISLYFIWQKRKIIFAEKNYLTGMGIPILLGGALLYLAGQRIENVLNRNDSAGIMMLSALLIIYGAFIISYGVQSFKAAVFPLLFLLLMIPIPSLLMEEIIGFLQAGSAEVVNLMLMVSGVPFLREGFVFHLPGMSVEITKQCSGIRSSLVLFIISLLAGHLFLKNPWKKGIMIALVLPIALLKNGIRILTLTLLGTYVDSSILTNSVLHRDGGVLFFMLSLLLLAPALYYLRDSESKKSPFKVKLSKARD